MSEPCKHEGKIATVMEKVENLEGWQKTQNGSINRVEEKVDTLKDAFFAWANKVLTGITIACVLLAVNIILGYLGG